MNPDPNPQHDTSQAIADTLAALRAATPPEGMEARIAARLAQQIALPAPAPSRLAALVPSAWWRGAITGAAIAFVATCAVLLIDKPVSQPIHGLNSPQYISAAQRILPQNERAKAIPVSASPAKPCASTKPQRTRGSAREDNNPSLHHVDITQSRPANQIPLTPQERALLELAHTANPTVLAALSSETQARSEADRAAEFNKFFAPPVRPPQPTDGQPSTNSTDNQSLL